VDGTSNTEGDIVIQTWPASFERCKIHRTLIHLIKIYLAPVVRGLDNAIHRINQYPIWISFDKINHAIRWIVIYPADSVIHVSNNPGLANSVIQPSNNQGLFAALVLVPKEPVCPSDP